MSNKLNGVSTTIDRVDFTKLRGKISVYLTDGRIIIVPINMFPDIKKLSMKQRKQYFIVEGQYLAFMRQPEMYPVTDFLKV